MQQLRQHEVRSRNRLVLVHHLSYHIMSRHAINKSRIIVVIVARTLKVRFEMKRKTVKETYQVATGVSILRRENKENSIFLATTYSQPVTSTSSYIVVPSINAGDYSST